MHLGKEQSTGTATDDEDVVTPLELEPLELEPPELEPQAVAPEAQRLRAADERPAPAPGR
jgi:hypothetical protein